jgi:ribose transport system ATP-binding protein
MLFPDHAAQPGEVHFRAENIANNDMLHGVSLAARHAEIHGVFGLIGSGIEELGKALYGAVPVTGGHLALGGTPFAPRSSADAIASGVGFVPGERKAEGLVADLSVRENFTLPFLRRYRDGIALSRSRQTAFATRWIEDLGVRTTGTEQLISGLSGGNQQKVCIGRWLVDDLKLLILEEPTRGVDLGARRDIYRHLRTLSDAGLTVIVISSDAEEIAGLADTSTVLAHGRDVRTFGAPATAEDLMHAAAARAAA